MKIEDTYRAGHVTFMGQQLLVCPGVLVPREETELLGYAALRILRKMSARTPRVVDMCCGSGNLACCIAVNVPNAQVGAADLTDDSVALARKNVTSLDLLARVTVCQGDLFAGLDTQLPTESIDAIVCAPPYISEHKLATTRAELLLHEPREAFDAGPYGLRIHQRVVKEALPFLRPEGVLMFEFGVGQANQIAKLFARTKSYSGVQLISDDHGMPRVAIAEKLSTSSEIKE